MKNQPQRFKLIGSLIMLAASGFLLFKAVPAALASFSNPNLDIPTELIRLFWGTIGIIYFAILALKILKSIQK